MKITFSDKLVAWLTLLSGLAISAVAEYYSIIGFTAIFAAAVIPVVIMGIVLGIGKIVATVWLKLNWDRAPFLVKTYLLIAIAVLMMITSMGIFGFLSKAHTDQSLVSGDVQSKIAVYDEKIKTARENIDANRKVLKQMDEAVDQVMGRSTSETGADKAVAIRRSQQKERARLVAEISAEQKTISQLSEERAPIAAEVRKVEAEVGPIKYIAALIYGDSPDTNLLEAAVRWVIIIIVVVFDPLAVILLLASQYSFQWFRKAREEELAAADYPPDDGPLTEDQLAQLKQSVELFRDRAEEANAKIAEIEPEDTYDYVPTAPMKFVDPGEHPRDYDETAVEEVAPVVEKSILEQNPYLNQPFSHFKDLQPMVYKPDVKIELYAGNPDDFKEPRSEEDKQRLTEVMTEFFDRNQEQDDSKFKIIPELQKELDSTPTEFPNNPFTGQQYKFVSIDGLEKNYIFNGTDWVYTPVNNADADKDLAESKKKSTYMIKQQDQQVIKTRE
jgi:hypothetical protein